MGYIVIGLVAGAITAALASTKNRSPLGWFVIGFILPVIGLILILVLPEGEGGFVDTTLDRYEPTTRKPPAASSPVEQIEKLAALHAQGALTDVEFETKKQVLLDRIV